jgi:hypothetical protein
MILIKKMIILINIDTVQCRICLEEDILTNLIKDNDNSMDN